MASQMWDYASSLATAYQNSGYAITTTTTDDTDVYITSGTQQYNLTNALQGWYGNGIGGALGGLAQQSTQQLAQSMQKPIEKAKNILESLRNEIHNWCANALEVA